MAQDVTTLTQAIELVAAGSWAVDTALRCLADDDCERAREVLLSAQSTMREGLIGLSDVLDASVREHLERPERLARALDSLHELRELSPVAADQ